jgi:hypothetical protein
MLSRLHRKFCEKIITGLSDGRSFALAYPHCSLKTARLRAQVDAIAGPAVLALIEKRRCLARVVWANLALRDPKIDGEMLVSLHVDDGRKKPHFKKVCIADEILTIKVDTQLAARQAECLRYPINAGRDPHWGGKAGHIDTAKGWARLVSVF